MPVRHTHFGIYAVLAARDGTVLLVRKARGPYTGTLDLPGGTPEFGETPVATAIREVREETGAIVAAADLRLTIATAFVHAAAEMDGSPAQWFHQATIFTAVRWRMGDPDHILPDSDAAGVCWARRDDPRLSPLARAVFTALDALDAEACIPAR